MDERQGALVTQYKITSIMNGVDLTEQFDEDLYRGTQSGHTALTD